MVVIGDLDHYRLRDSHHMYGPARMKKFIINYTYIDVNQYNYLPQNLQSLMKYKSLDLH